MNVGGSLESMIDVGKLTKEPIKQFIQAKRSTFVNLKNGDLFDLIFAERDEVSLGREDVFNFFEKDVELGILSAFVWGFPTGGRGRLTRSIIDNFDSLKTILNTIRNTELNEADFSALNRMKGLNFATNTKFLYFARSNIEQSPCLIFDKMVKDFLAIRRPHEYKDMFSYFDMKYSYGIDFKVYREYVIRTNEVAQLMGGLSSDALELYFFKYSPSRRRAIR